MHETLRNITDWVLGDTFIFDALEQNGLVDLESKNALLLLMIKLFSMESKPESEQDRVIEEIYANYPWLETTYIREKRSFPVIFSEVHEAAKHAGVTSVMLLRLLSDEPEAPDEKIAS